MRCYIARKIESPFDTVLQRTRDNLKAERLDVVEELELEPGVSDSGRHLTRRLIMARDEAGVLLPCNVMVQQKDDGVEVSAIDPQDELDKVGSTRVAELAKPVHDKLEAAFSAI